MSTWENGIRMKPLTENTVVSHVWLSEFAIWYTPMNTFISLHFLSYPFPSLLLHEGWIHSSHGTQINRNWSVVKIVKIHFFFLNFEINYNITEYLNQPLLTNQFHTLMQYKHNYHWELQTGQIWWYECIFVCLCAFTTAHGLIASPVARTLPLFDHLRSVRLGKECRVVVF